MTLPDADFEPNSTLQPKGGSDMISETPLEGWRFSVSEGNVK
jgi:hypothetical protein